MEYKASLDLLAKVLTGATFILFSILGYRSIKALAMSHGDTTTILTHSGILILFLSIFLGSYLYAPQKYILSKDELIITRPIKERKIKFSDIEEIKIIADIEMKGISRTFGVGGLFGYYGKYYNSEFGHMIFYTTQRKNNILIRTKQGKIIIITPDDITIIQKIKEHLPFKT